MRALRDAETANIPFLDGTGGRIARRNAVGSRVIARPSCFRFHLLTLVLRYSGAFYAKEFCFYVRERTELSVTNAYCRHITQPICCVRLFADRCRFCP